jgi:hypothetical protein
MPKHMEIFFLPYKHILRNFMTCWRVSTVACTHFNLRAHFNKDLAAKEEERVWVKRQTDGELDFSRLTEGLTGEATVYKRRGMAKPEIGRPQIK